MILSFRKGIFSLSQSKPFSQKERSHLRLEGFVQVDENLFQTDNLRAAARFRPRADTTSAKVFKRILVQDFEIPSLPPLAFLDSHQREGVEWILSRSRSYLAHAPGAGKTGTMLIAAMLAKGEGMRLLIVPPHLTTNWEQEVWKFSALLDKRAYWSTATVSEKARKGDRVDWDADFVILPDSMLARSWVLEEIFKRKILFVAADEAHRYKEETTTRAKMLFGGKSGALESTGLVQEAKHAVLASGTPMPNRPIELWAPTFAMAPEVIDFMSRVDFGRKFCGGHLGDRGEWIFKGSANEDELKRKLQKKFMHRVSEDELDLPEKRRSIVYMKGDPRSPLMKAWERKNAPRLSFKDIDEDMSQGKLAEYRREVGLGKIDWTAEYVSHLIEETNRNVLLFAWHRDVVAGLALKLSRFEPGVIMGGTPIAERERVREAFQAGKNKLVILNIEAGGEGSNYQAADEVIFCEYSWADTKNNQCEKRAHRRGRKGRVNARYIVAPDTLDQVILSSVMAKAEIEKKVIG